MSQSPYLSPEEVAAYFNVNPETIRRLCRDRKIPGARQIGRSWRIPRSYLEHDPDEVKKEDDEEKQ
jgi:excisionase family DNA binding protein